MKVYLDSHSIKIREEDLTLFKQLETTFLQQPTDEMEVYVGNDRKIINHPEEYKSLKLIQLMSAGYDPFNIEKLKEHNITLCNARGVYSYGIAEFVVTRLLEVNQELRWINQQTKWNKKIEFRSLLNQKGAILGTGSIATEIARLLKVFGVHLDGYNTKGTKVDYFDSNYPLEQFDDHAQSYDFVIITLPLNDQTKYYFDKERLLSLKSDSVLINIARGPLVKESDLIEVLDNHFKAVILDVFEKEPLDDNSPLWTHPKAYLSSHISFRNNLYKENLYQLIKNNLLSWAQGSSLTNIV